MLTRHLVAVCSQARLNMVCLHRPPCLNLPMQTEEYWGNVNPIGERSCYDEGKRAAECLTMDYHREHGQEVGACQLHWCASFWKPACMQPSASCHGKHGQEVGSKMGCRPAADSQASALPPCTCPAPAQRCPDRLIPWAAARCSDSNPVLTQPLVPMCPTVLCALLPPPCQVRIVRIFNTYGPRMALDDGRVVSNFVSQVRLFGRCRGLGAAAAAVAVAAQAVWVAGAVGAHRSFSCCALPSLQLCRHLFLSTSPSQALKNEPLTLFGDGKQTRSFQFVSDLIEGETGWVVSLG